MQLQARLVHAEPGSRVVEVAAHRDGAPLGSALGEAADAETAEERAISRLLQRLAPKPPARQPQPAPEQVELLQADRPDEQLGEQLGERPGVDPPASPAEPPAEPTPDPDDWSAELARIDLELRRLGWQREQEAAYLERAFGHPSRSRLTSYGDLLAYLEGLQALEAGTDPASAPVPLRRRDLLAQCDQLLERLQWDAARGRQFLERHFERGSRQQLSDTQLLQFNMLLEGELVGL